MFTFLWPLLNFWQGSQLLYWQTNSLQETFNWQSASWLPGHINLGTDVRHLQLLMKCSIIPFVIYMTILCWPAKHGKWIKIHLSVTASQLSTICLCLTIGYHNLSHSGFLKPYQFISGIIWRYISLLDIREINYILKLYISMSFQHRFRDDFNREIVKGNCNIYKYLIIFRNIKEWAGMMSLLLSNSDNNDEQMRQQWARWNRKLIKVASVHTERIVREDAGLTILPFWYQDYLEILKIFFKFRAELLKVIEQVHIKRLPPN